MTGVRSLLLLIALTVSGAAQSGSPPRNVAIVSLIGDVMTVDVYRARTGTSINKNDQTVIPVTNAFFDRAALASTADAVFARLPQDASVATLAVPKRGSGFDPAGLLVDDAVSRSNPLVAALRNEGFSHLVAITRHRSPARVEMADGSVGAGNLEGLGFYVDHSIRTERVDNRAPAYGIIAPYVYIRLLLIDLDTLAIQGDQKVTASVVRTSEANRQGEDPWGALSAEEKAEMLLSLLNRQVKEAVPRLFETR